jgi:uncharacterized membrane protein
MTFLKRFFRHVWMSPIQVKRAYPQTTLTAIEQAVAKSEKNHRGQVRFVVEAELTTGQLWAGMSARQRAVDVFSAMRVWDTAENNGVLVYVLLADRKVEIVADRGIQQHVGDERWRAICKELELHYSKGDFVTGSVTTIEKISAELTHYFPANGETKNEQCDKPILI